MYTYHIPLGQCVFEVPHHTYHVGRRFDVDLSGTESEDVQRRTCHGASEINAVQLSESSNSSLRNQYTSCQPGTS
jgi:hypothetical protein